MIKKKERYSKVENLQTPIGRLGDWVTCFNEYLIEKQLKLEPELLIEQLPQILSDFYVDLRKKNVKKIAHKLGDTGKIIPQSNDQCEDYKNTSLKCIQAALNRHFKVTRNLDIITNESFIQCNKMFQGVTKKGKREGTGEVESKPPIEPEDMEKMSNYFTKIMKSEPNAAKLQEIILFNVIYFGGRHCRANLRNMKINSFEITTDIQNRQYIHQVMIKITLKRILSRLISQEFMKSQIMYTGSCLQ